MRSLCKISSGREICSNSVLQKVVALVTPPIMLYRWFLKGAREAKSERYIDPRFG